MDFLLWGEPGRFLLVDGGGEAELGEREDYVSDSRRGTVRPGRCGVDWGALLCFSMRRNGKAVGNGITVFLVRASGPGTVGWTGARCFVSRCGGTGKRSGMEKLFSWFELPDRALWGEPGARCFVSRCGGTGKRSGMEKLLSWFELPARALWGGLGRCCCSSRARCQETAALAVNSDAK